MKIRNNVNVSFKSNCLVKGVVNDFRAATYAVEKGAVDLHSDISGVRKTALGYLVIDKTTLVGRLFDRITEPQKIDEAIEDIISSDVKLKTLECKE